MKNYKPAQNEPEVMKRVEDAIAHGYVAVCNCSQCQQIPMYQNAPLEDFIQLEENEQDNGRQGRGR